MRVVNALPPGNGELATERERDRMNAQGIPHCFVIDYALLACGSMADTEAVVMETPDDDDAGVSQDATAATGEVGL